MPTFQRCPQAVSELALEILCKYEEHKPLLDAKVKIDFCFAYGDRDEKTGAVTGYAIVKNGVRCYGLARKMPLKDRAMGRGDAEITLDHDHWNDIPDKQRRALLDHELHHLSVKMDKRGLCRDDLNRPIIVLRDHDYDFGWFRIVAERHGQHSIELIQAHQMMDTDGQLFWPALTK